MIDRHEFIQFSLYDSLSRSAGRVLDLFKRFDRDGNHSVDGREFRRAIRELGFAPHFYSDADVDLVFAAIDEDDSGAIDLRELTKALRPSTVASNKHQLRKRTEGRRGQALGAHVKLVTDGSKGLLEQLSEVLVANRVRLIDLFRSWDEDGNGVVSPAEFSRALAVLGYAADERTVGELFASFDRDGSGELEFTELNRALKAAAAAKPKDGKSGGGARDGGAAPTASPVVSAANADVADALDEMRSSTRVRLAAHRAFAARIAQLEASIQRKHQTSAITHADAMQRQLVATLRVPSVLNRVPPQSARGPPKRALPDLADYLTPRPWTATPPAATGLLMGGAPTPRPR